MTLVLKRTLWLQWSTCQLILTKFMITYLLVFIASPALEFPILDFLNQTFRFQDTHTNKLFVTTYHQPLEEVHPWAFFKLYSTVHHMHEETKVHRGEVTCLRSRELMVQPGQELRSVLSPEIFPLPYHAFVHLWFMQHYILSENYFHSLEISQLPIQRFLSDCLQWSLKIIWSVKVQNWGTMGLSYIFHRYVSNPKS